MHKEVVAKCSRISEVRLIYFEQRKNYKLTHIIVNIDIRENSKRNYLINRPSF